MIQNGQKVQFDPLKFITGFETNDNKGKLTIGTVVFVNDWGKWFSVEYGEPKQRTSFKFSQIGKDVRIVG